MVRHDGSILVEVAGSSPVPRLRSQRGWDPPAMISRMRLIRTERDPGTRRHAYVVNRSWYESTVTGNPFLERGEADLREGIAVLGDSPAADRLTETLELVQFLREETHAMMRRWQDRKAALRARCSADRA
jgi:hypothetical protein